MCTSKATPVSRSRGWCSMRTIVSMKVTLIRRRTVQIEGIRNIHMYISTYVSHFFFLATFSLTFHWRKISTDIFKVCTTSVRNMTYFIDLLGEIVAGQLPDSTCQHYYRVLVFCPGHLHMLPGGTSLSLWFDCSHNWATANKCWCLHVENYHFITKCHAPLTYLSQ